MGYPAPVVKTVRTETIANMVINAALATLITWLAFRGMKSIPLVGGPDSGAFGIIPGTFLFTTIITIVLTLVMKGRVRAGKVALLSPSELPAAIARLPENVFLRGIVMGVGAWIILVPATLALLSAIAPSAVSFTWLLVFYICYFVLLALLVVPVIVLRSLKDVRRPGSR